MGSKRQSEVVLWERERKLTADVRRLCEWAGTLRPIHGLHPDDKAAIDLAASILERIGGSDD